jgi:hypothetical protein
MKTAALAALVVAFAVSRASAAPIEGGLSLHVSPTVGGQRTTFRLDYREPGGFASETRADSIALTGPRGVGCVSTETLHERMTAPGSEVVVRLRPTSGRAWCAGTFQGQVDETIRPRCGPAQVCPMFIALVPIGHFRFVVHL